LDDHDLPRLEEAIGVIWDKAREMGLDPFPTHFEIVPATILYEFGAYLLPGRFSHWTHGKAYVTHGDQTKRAARAGRSFYASNPLTSSVA
jgi:spore cortex formation protein SpoVR/YcgB (stage V sporulation)